MLSRVDATVDFSWGNNSPDPAVPSDYFSARWTGKVKPQYSETYTFYTVSNNGVRLWVNGQLLIDDWNSHNTTEDSATINLVAGQKYDIKMEYFENAYTATAQLFWSSARQAKEIIPESALTSDASAPTSNQTNQASTAIANNLNNSGLTGSNIGQATGGSRELADGSWELTSAGIGVSGIADSGHFESAPQTGNFQALVRIQSLTSSGTAPEVGLMLRESTAADARFAMVAATPDAYTYASRTTAGGSASKTAIAVSAKFPEVWVLNPADRRHYRICHLDGRH